MNNTYGIKSYNETVYNYAEFATSMKYGCLDQINICRAAASDFKGGLIDQDRVIRRGDEKP